MYTSKTLAFFNSKHIQASSRQSHSQVCRRKIVDLNRFVVLGLELKAWPDFMTSCVSKTISTTLTTTLVVVVATFSSLDSTCNTYCICYIIPTHYTSIPPPRRRARATTLNMNYIRRDGLVELC